MKFTRQFETRPIVERVHPKKRSNTVQGAILSNQKIVDKFLQGNMYGITFNPNTSFDSDNADFDENQVIAIDRSDRLISLYQLKNRHSYLVQIAQAAEAARLAKLEQSQTPEQPVAE